MLINYKAELEYFTPIQLNFDDIEGEIPDNIKNSAILFNKALDNIKVGSEDIAIIELRKAISMNPDFLKAMNLLGLAYCIMNDFTSAAQVFKRVIEAEKNSVKALEYMNRISGMNMEDTKVVPVQKVTKKKVKAAKTKKQAPKSSQKDDIIFGRFKFDPANFILGIVIGIILILFIGFIYFFFIDTGDDKEEDIINNPLDTVLSQKIRLEVEEEHNKQLTEKDSEIDQLKNDLEAAKKSSEYLKNVIILNDVENLFELEKYEEAADLFLKIKELQFTGEDGDLYDKIVAEDMNKAAWALYNAGLDHFKKAQYSMALERFLKVDAYVEEWESMDWLMYHTGVCYKESNDSRKALEIFEEIKEEYPRSGTLQYVEYMIDQILNNV